MAYLPGTEGGTAVADVLFGQVNPSGHVPVSWPSEATRNPPLSQFNPGAPSLLGDQPRFFDQLPGTNFGPGLRVQRPLPVRVRTLVHHPSRRAVSPSPLRLPGRQRERDVHAGQHGQPRRGRRRTRLRAPADQRRRRATAAAGRLREGGARRRSVADRPGLVPRLQAGRDAGGHRRNREPRRRARLLPGSGRDDDRGLLRRADQSRRGGGGATRLLLR
jgi:hypothetical protein